MEHITIVPIIVGATGIMAKSLENYIKLLNSNIDISIIQKQAAIITNTIVVKSLGNDIYAVRESEDPYPWRLQGGTLVIPDLPVRHKK